MSGELQFLTVSVYTSMQALLITGNFPGWFVDTFIMSRSLKWARSGIAALAYGGMFMDINIHEYNATHENQ